jgi:hypothetical protein
MCKRKFKGTVPWIFYFKFFHESVSPKPLSIPIGPFEIFLKICGNIRSSRCTTSVGADAGGKFTTGVIDTSGKLPLVSLTPEENLTPAANLTTVANLTPAANLLSVSLTLVAKLQRWAQMFFEIQESQIRKLFGSICI